MVFADAHYVEFETPSYAIVDPSTATLPAPHKVRGQGRAHERIAFIEARNLEALPQFRQSQIFIHHR